MHNMVTLKKAIGLFSYYSKWIFQFSKLIRPLLKVDKFPLDREEMESFQALKQTLADATLYTIDDDKIFTVETDASDHTLT